MLCLTWAVLWIGERLSRDKSGLWSFVFFIMKNRAPSKTAQVMSLGLCATLLLFTLMLMRDIGDSMVSHTRSHNGNLIVTEALSPQLADIEHWAGATGSSIKDMRLFQRAQLTRINNRSPELHAGHPSETLSVIQKQIRLSWSEAVPDNNRIVAGDWWARATPEWQQVSVEEEVMVDLELEIGDVLTFLLGDRELELEIVASHAVTAGGSAVTFWFTAPPSIVRELPKPLRAMGSMELPDAAWPRLSELLTQHPTLAVVSLRELTQRFDATLSIMTRLTVAYSAMILLLSIAVLLASMICFEADDRQRNGLLKSMGLADRGCLRLALYEWMLTGLLAASGAIGGTWLAGQLIYRSQFQLSYQPDPLWMLGTLGVCCALVCALGIAFSKAALRASPRQLLAMG
jgi:predicted lysophospholipase L1 biosynthesis ABC-type transport system permease subunit